MVGLAAVLAVQTRKADAALDGHEPPTLPPTPKRSRRVQARYDLAVEAIKTFHTGVSEDFLLKEDQFKELRDRLLKSAADFYGKLGALLGKETDVASRRALAQSNFELADLTRKVGRNEAALAAHRAVLAAREALAAETGATHWRKGRRRPEPDGRRVSARCDGEDVDEALAAYRRAESLLAGLAGSDPEARAALAACRTAMARPLLHAGKPAEALAACKLARADQEALAAAPRSLERHPPRPRGHAQRARHRALADG